VTPEEVAPDEAAAAPLELDFRAGEALPTLADVVVAAGLEVPPVCVCTCAWLVGELVSVADDVVEAPLTARG